MSDSLANAGGGTNDDDFTLDPPGRLAVIGAGPIGVECALYGRYLGYDVILIEAETVASTLTPLSDHPLPMMPDRCLSPLAKAAITAQTDSGEPNVLPLTIGEWITQGLHVLVESDLLAGRLWMPCRCLTIEHVPVAASDSLEGADGNEEDDGEIPPDFQLLLESEGDTANETVEAVILATGDDHGIELRFTQPAAYFFHLVQQRSGDVAADLHQGWREIVAAYAGLMGRPELDLYRPRRV